MLSLGVTRLKRWLLHAKLERGVGVSQIRVAVLMDGRNAFVDDFNEVMQDVLSLIDGTQEYDSNVFLRLGVFEGNTEFEAYLNYTKLFDGSNKDSMVWMAQVQFDEIQTSGVIDVNVSL